MSDAPEKIGIAPCHPFSAPDDYYVVNPRHMRGPKVKEYIRADLYDAERAENERLREALEIADSWLTMWAGHVANCPGGEKCSCGLTRVRFDVALACIYRAALETKGGKDE